MHIVNSLHECIFHKERYSSCIQSMDLTQNKLSKIYNNLRKKGMSSLTLRPLDVLSCRRHTKLCSVQIKDIGGQRLDRRTLGPIDSTGQEAGEVKSFLKRFPVTLLQYHMNTIQPQKIAICILMPLFKSGKTQRVCHNE